MPFTKVVIAWIDYSLICCNAVACYSVCALLFTPDYIVSCMILLAQEYLTEEVVGNCKPDCLVHPKARVSGW
jgi:hypothetical protein